MKGFKFRLEKVLEVTGTRLRQKQKDHARVMLKIQETELELQQLEDRKNSYVAQLNQMNDQAAQDWYVAWQYLHELNVMVEKVRDTLARFRAESEQIRNELLQFHQKEKVLQNLKTRSLQQYSQRLDRQQQNLLDELATQSSQKELM